MYEKYGRIVLLVSPTGVSSLSWERYTEKCQAGPLWSIMFLAYLGRAVHEEYCHLNLDPLAYISVPLILCF